MKYFRWKEGKSSNIATAIPLVKQVARYKKESFIMKPAAETCQALNFPK